MTLKSRATAKKPSSRNAKESTASSTDAQARCSLSSAASVSAHLAKIKPWRSVLDRAKTHRLSTGGHLIGGGFLRRGRAHSCIGEPGAGKTLLLGHGALCLVTEKAFFGRPVQQSRVAFFAAEAADSTLDRLYLAAKRAGLGWPVDGLCVFPNSIDLKDSSDLERAIALLKAERAEVFFVDTANASGAGAEDNQDMPKYSQALTTIITETRAAGTINHHTPLGNSTRERGHTSFRGMLDLSVVVTKKPDGTREISFGKARDGEEAPFGSYRIDVESLGTTNLGEPFTVPYLVELGVVQQTKKVRTAKQVILDVLAGSPGKKTSRETLHEAYRLEVPGNLPRSARRNLNDTLERLQKAGIIDVSGHFVILASDREVPGSPSGSSGPSWNSGSS